MKAQDIMAKDPRCVTPRTSIQEAASLMKSEDVGALPVVESESSKRLVGIVSQADVVRKASSDRKAENTVERISEPGGKHQG